MHQSELRNFALEVSIIDYHQQSLCSHFTGLEKLKFLVLRKKCNCHFVIILFECDWGVNRKMDESLNNAAAEHGTWSFVHNSRITLCGSADVII